SRAASGAHRSRRTLSFELRHRDGAAGICGVGRELRAAPARHVRLRVVVRARTAALTRSRSAGDQASLLLARRRIAALRVAGEGAPRGRATRAGDFTIRPALIPRVWGRERSPDGDPRRPGAP